MQVITEFMILISVITLGSAFNVTNDIIHHNRIRKRYIDDKESINYQFHKNQLISDCKLLGLVSVFFILEVVTIYYFMLGNN